MEPRLTATALELRRGALHLGPLSVDLGPGIYLIAGANGAGKSTLYRALSGVQALTGGQVRVNGLDPFTDPAARREIGWVPADAEHPDFLTVGETWRFQAALRERPAWDGASLAKRLGIREDLPLGQCSTGQRRKAAILAGLSGDPSVWLLDEVFAPLDAAAAEAFSALLVERRRDRVILLTAHGTVPVPVDAALTLREGQLTAAA